MKLVPIFFPFPCRNQLAPYLCTYLRSINTALPQSAYYIVDPDCLDWERFKNRWEFAPWNQWFHEYSIDQALQPVRFDAIDASLFKPLIRSNVTPVRAWRSLILERYPPLEDYLNAALDRAATALGGIDCVLTWINIASLKHVCATRGIPLVHNEHGPLRKPTYRHTAYFDFSGVNGQTSVVQEHRDFCEQLSHWNDWPSLDSIRRALLTDRNQQQPLPIGPQRYRCGLATQLEEDSNLIAFGNGFSNLDLVRHCQDSFGVDNVLTRLHPQGLSITLGHIDTSANARQFIGQCDEIHTINSSVAAEALLLGKPIFTYGNSPLKIAMRPISRENGAVWTSLGAESPERSAAFFFLSYLMPYSLVFDPAYIGWRLNKPNHLERMLVHLRHYCDLPLQSDASTTEQMKAELFALLDRLANSTAQLATEPPETQTTPSEPLIFEGVPSFYRLIEEYRALLAERNSILSERNTILSERDAMLKSKSWKITAPLRWLDAMLRRPDRS